MTSAAPAPRVSVVIPTHQRRELVLGAVASVRTQTLAPGEVIEVIVVDDGSTDGTGEAIAALAGGIRYVWQPNRGVSAARNAGLRLARGELVAFLDSDDRWLPDHLAVVTEVLRRRPEAVLCSTAPRFEIGGRRSPQAAELVDALPALLVENVVGCPSAVAVRRDALVAAHGFDERLPVMEGWELWLRLARRGPFAYLRRRTIVVQSAPDSLTARAGRGGQYLGALEIVAATAAAVAAEPGRADGAELAARAAGLAAYFAALRALAGDDTAAAAPALAAACARLPELSRHPQLVANRLALVRFGPEGRLTAFAAAARAWPDRGADTPLYLRLHALALALRLGRGGAALRLLRDWPLAATPRFLARNPALFARLARRRWGRRAAEKK